MYLQRNTADCIVTAEIDQGLLYTIAELSALERMRKRAADDDSTSLRNIYLETRQSTELSSTGYAAVKISLYKWRRIHQPSLPSSIDAVADAIHNSKYALLHGSS